MTKTYTYLFLFSFVLLSSDMFSQDSTFVVSSKNEENHLKFQDHFFKALSQKAINSYQLAIQNLEICNELQPMNKAVLFELSKNYFSLKRFVESIEYGNQALELEPDNTWIMKHLVKAYKESHQFSEAIHLQKKLAERFPAENEQLAYLYFQNKDYKNANALLIKMEETKTLSLGLRMLKGRFPNPKIKKSIKKKATLNRLISNFDTDKNFETLHQILTLTKTTNNKLLLKYSTLGIELYPTQPSVYLMNGIALNNNQRYESALESLQNGIDFVIENINLEILFYNEFARSYTGLGNKKSAIKSQNKALELRKKLKRK